MKIQFSCHCGKSYEVAETLAGKKVLCKSCQQPLRVPTAPQSPSNLRPPAAATITQKPVRYSAAALKLKAEHARNERGQGFTAANPGLLSPSLLLYFRNFPHRIAIRIGLLLAFLGLSFVHWIAIPPTLLMSFLTVRYARSIRGQFVSGCIAPAKILSANLPLLAVYTDLSIGPNSCKVIRLMEQPLQRLSPADAKPGRTCTICYYFGMYPGLSEHWFTPLPTMPHFVTRKRDEIQRIYESIPDEEWQSLEMGLQQLPKNPEQRTYRVIRPDFQPRLAFASAAELTNLVRPYMAEADAKIGKEITEETIGKVNKCLAQPINRSGVVAVCEAFGAGVVITPQVLLFFSPKADPLSIPWNQIKVAYINLESMEIVSTTNQRIVVKCDCDIKTFVQLEKLINKAVGVGPNDERQFQNRF